MRYTNRHILYFTLRMPLSFGKSKILPSIIGPNVILFAESAVYSQLMLVGWS